MGAQLRIVLDQLVDIDDADQAEASVALAKALVTTAPVGCSVEAIVPKGADVTLEGIDGVRTLRLARRELCRAWVAGIARGAGAGLIHAPTLLAPLVKHDRVHDPDQTTITLWDLTAWEAPQTLPKTEVAWQRAMLKRAVKHADAVVVPSHAIGEKLGEIAPLSDRVRVIAGAAPTGLAMGTDASNRRADLLLPSDDYLVLTGAPETLVAGFRAASALDIQAIVLDAAEGSEPLVTEFAPIAGLSESRVHVRGHLEPEDRAAVIGGARALVACENRSAWPWRAIESMALGVPTVAVDSGVHRDVIADGGAVVGAEELTDAAIAAAGEDAKRLAVLASDRSRAFSWLGAGERIWALHADL